MHAHTHTHTLTQQCTHTPPLQASKLEEALSKYFGPPQAIVTEDDRELIVTTQAVSINLETPFLCLH